MNNFCNTYNVSRETYLKLENYHKSLLEWEEKFNLISKNSIEEIWCRHFEDSAQIFKLIPSEAKTLLDIGSGAGFPGMVIAIMATERTPYLKITLVDSIGKKTLYLNYVKEILALPNVEILNQRAEKLNNHNFDVITARAVTALNTLLKYAYPLLSKNGICIFPKGRNYENEVSFAKKYWDFKMAVVQSKTSENGKILIISNLTKKGKK